MSLRASYTITHTDEHQVIIRDDGVGMSVTNDAENVVEDMIRNGTLQDGQRLYYRDTEGQVDQLEHKNGVFTGFSFGGPS